MSIESVKNRMRTQMKMGRYILDINANKVGIRVFERYVSLMTSPFRLRVSRTGSKVAGFIQNRYLMM